MARTNIVASTLMSAMVPCLVLIALVGSDAKRVVFIPPPVLSIARCHMNVGRALSQLGHEIWFAIPSSLDDTRIGIGDNVSIIRYNSRPSIDTLIKEVTINYLNGNPAFVKAMVAHVTDNFDDILRNQTFFNEIKNLHADLMVLDNFPIVRVLAVLPYKMDIPFAMLGKMYDVFPTRIPYSPGVTPYQLFPSNDDMTFFQRLKMAVMYTFLSLYDPFTQNDLVSVYAPEKPYISNDMLMTRAEIWLVDMDHVLDYPRPTLPNVKLIGGTSVEPAKTLPQKFQSFMDSAPNGVVIVTFGGNIIHISQQLSEKLFKVFRKLRMKVIFRSTLPSPDPDNILTSTWIPQNDLLGHPNTKLFFSHCGKNANYEALYHAVPIIGIPICGDQFYNAERIQRKGFGEVVNLAAISVDELFAVTIKVIKEPRYKQAISKASELYRELYKAPAKEAAKWLDHLMQYGGDYMRYAGQKMPMYQFLLLDVLAFIIAVALLSSLLIIVCIRFLLQSCIRRKQKKE